MLRYTHDKENIHITIYYKEDKMKKKTKILKLLCASLIFSGIIFCAKAGNVEASPVLGKQLLNGVTNRKYFIATNISHFTTTIDSAIYDWNNSTGSPGTITPIWFIKTTQSSLSVMDFRRDYEIPDPPGGVIYGYTRFYSSNSTQINPSISNWYYARIDLDSVNLNSLGTIQGKTKKSVIAHEIGHGIGLGEYNTNPYSIMCQIGSNRQVDRAQQVDLNQINILY
jgi:hypothetical protein